MVAVPTYLYHGTWISNIDNIKKEGLVPGKEKNWDSSEDDKIYLTLDKEEAYDFVINSDNWKDEEIAVIEINTIHLDKSLFDIDNNIDYYEDEIPYSFTYEGVISPSNFSDIIIMEA